MDTSPKIVASVFRPPNTVEDIMPLINSNFTLIQFLLFKCQGTNLSIKTSPTVFISCSLLYLLPSLDFFMLFPSLKPLIKALFIEHLLCTRHGAQCFPLPNLKLSTGFILIFGKTNTIM